MGKITINYEKEQIDEIGEINMSNMWIEPRIENMEIDQIIDYWNGGHIRPEAIHSVIRTLANCNFAIYIFGGLIGIDYKTWIDVAMAGNIIIMPIMAGRDD